MRLFPYVKKDLISFLREGKIVIISFLLFPMIMAYIYGVMQEDLFSGKSNFNPIKVEFKYDKSSKEGEIFSSILEDKNVKSFIDAHFEGQPECKVSISKDFKSIDIEKLKNSDTQIDMVKGFMQTFSENINQYKVVAFNVSKLSLSSEEKGALINKLINKLSENNKKSLIKEELVEGYRSLGSREYYTISMFSFTSMMLIMVLGKIFYKEKKQGVVRRSFSTPNSKKIYLAGYVTSSFIIAFSINIIYIVINRILKIAFSGSIIEILILVFLQSLLQAAVIGTIISFIKSEKIANSVMNVLIFIPVIIGGVFFNSEIIEIKILKVISNFAPNSLILNSYKNLYITQGISGASTEVIIGALLSLVLLAASFLKVKANWEE